MNSKNNPIKPDLIYIKKQTMIVNNINSYTKVTILKKYMLTNLNTFINS